MNAYELADWMENAIISDDWGELAKYYGWCNQHIPTMLRQQADRIAELEKDLHMIQRHYDQLETSSSGNNGKRLSETNESLPRGKE